MLLLRWIGTTLRRQARVGFAGLLFALLLWAGGGGSAASVLAQSQASLPVRLPGHVLSVLSQATKLTPASAPHGAAAVQAATPQASQPLTLTVVLNRRDEVGFQKYLADVENPMSPNHLHFLTQAQLTKRFGPSQQAYTAVLSYFQQQGFSLEQGSANRLTLTLKATRAQTEQALAVHIDDYQLGTRTFYANGQDPAVPASIAPDIQAISGMSNLARPRQPLPSNDT